MKSAKISDKITERKIIQVSRTLPELTVKHFFLLPDVCTFKIKIKSLPTLVFHLVSVRTVSPLCSAKGLTTTNSIQDFPKLPIIKEKLSAGSQATSGHLQQPQQPQGGHPMPFLAAPAWPQGGDHGTKMQAHTKGRFFFPCLSDNSSEVLKVLRSEMLLNGTNST